MTTAEMTPVNSTSIKGVHHDESTNTLLVQFVSGGVYRYDNVDKAEYEALIAAPSVGKQFHIFKGKHEGTKL